jgi:hypothetical protein
MMEGCLPTRGGEGAAGQGRRERSGVAGFGESDGCVGEFPISSDASGCGRRDQCRWTRGDMHCMMRSLLTRRIGGVPTASFKSGAAGATAFDHPFTSTL